MTDRPPTLRQVAIAIALVLALRLLASTAGSGVAQAKAGLNQTIPTRTPTAPPQTPTTPPTTNPAAPTSAPDARTPRATEPGAPPLPSGTAPGTLAPDVRIQTDTPAAPGPDATGSVASTPLAPATTSEPGLTIAPGETAVGSPSQLTVTSIAGQAAEARATLTVPPWTPAVAGLAAGGGVSCLWAVAGLALVATGVFLLTAKSRLRRKT